MIRRLEKSDREQLLKLFWDFHNHSLKNLPTKEIDQFRQYKDTESVFNRDVGKYISEDQFITFVADINGKLVGYCTARIEEKPDKVLDKEAYIEDWFVEKEFRGKNLGEKLFDATIAAVKKRGCTHLKLDTFVNNKKAQDIYHKYGFIDYVLVMYKKI